MFKICEDIPDPHVEEVFGMYGVKDQVYTEGSWDALYTAAKIYIGNVLVDAFIQAANQFRNEIGVKQKHLRNLPLLDKFVVCTPLAHRYLTLFDIEPKAWTSNHHHLDNLLMTFTGLDPEHIYDVSFTRRVAERLPGIEVVMKLRLHINPTTAVKHIVEFEEN